MCTFTFGIKALPPPKSINYSHFIHTGIFSCNFNETTFKLNILSSGIYPIYKSMSD